MAAAKASASIENSNYKRGEHEDRMILDMVNGLSLEESRMLSCKVAGRCHFKLRPFPHHRSTFDSPAPVTARGTACLILQGRCLYRSRAPTASSRHCSMRARLPPQPEFRFFFGAGLATFTSLLRANDN